MNTNTCTRFGLLEVEGKKLQQSYPILTYSHLPLEILKFMVETFPKFKLQYCTIKSETLVDQVELGDYQELINCHLENVPVKISGRRNNVTGCHFS